MNGSFLVIAGEYVTRVKCGVYRGLWFLYVFNKVVSQIIRRGYIYIQLLQLPLSFGLFQNKKIASTSTFKYILHPSIAQTEPYSYIQMYMFMIMIQFLLDRNNPFPKSATIECIPRPNWC